MMKRNEKRRNRRRNWNKNWNGKGNSKICLRWLELPDELTVSILSRLGAVEIIDKAQKVCTKWREISKDPSMWKSIDMRNDNNHLGMSYNLEKMCMHAIDCSGGGLVDINIEYFGTDHLLHHLAQRASKLKRLRLIDCPNISDEGLSGAASKFPLLEELEIYLGEGAIAAVGRCCPLLKTFKFNQRGIRSTAYIDDKVALQIAENMPGLRHLQLIGNKLTNRGLEAILDGCPHLESLDLRRCFFVYLEEGGLGKRCSQQIKHLRRPDDSVSDFGFSAEVDFGVHFGVDLNEESDDDMC